MCVCVLVNCIKTASDTHGAAPQASARDAAMVVLAEDCMINRFGSLEMFGVKN